MRGLALKLGSLSGGYAFKGTGLPAYHQLSIASNSRLGWHFVPSSPFLLGFGLDGAGTGLGHAVTTAVAHHSTVLLSLE